MALSLEEFRDALLASGVLAEDGLPEFEATLSQPPADAQALARALVEHRKLTKYQAAHIYQGNALPLLLGNYVIQDKIGSGGMGRVYKAHHRLLDRTVAIKLLPAEATNSPGTVKRFIREARAAAALTHQNIVRTYDVDQQEGLHYLVMEYVAGKNLATIIKQEGPLPIPQAIECIRQAATGLAYAHEQGIIHRDIKPANLLLQRRGRPDEPPAIKILDMGLARVASATGSDDSALTRTGQVMGTVDYMSPEQASDTRLADQRSDVYSLGCTLYVLVTGKVPYYEKSLMKKLLAHRERPIPDIRAKRPDAPQRLANISRCMMAKEPDQRPQSMLEVINLLEEDNADLPSQHKLSIPQRLDSPLSSMTSDLESSPQTSGAGQNITDSRKSTIAFAILVLVALAIGGIVLVAVLVMLLAYLF